MVQVYDFVCVILNYSIVQSIPGIFRNILDPKKGGNLPHGLFAASGMGCEVQCRFLELI